MSELAVRNRQRARPVNLPLLRRIARAVLDERRPGRDFDLGVYLVAAPEMARLNEKFLSHTGSTDVITFNYAEPNSTGGLAGEIFISVEDAVQQARQFRTTWPAEVVRYLVHGLLHLEGYDDLTAAARRVMKREENRLVRNLARLFPLSDLARGPKVGP